MASRTVKLNHNIEFYIRSSLFAEIGLFSEDLAVIGWDAVVD